MNHNRFLQLQVDVDSDFQWYLSNKNQPLRSIGPIAPINILIGATNSGKSRFMRALLRTNIYIFHSDTDLELKIEKLKHTYEEISKIIEPISIHIDPTINYLFYERGPNWLEPLFKKRKIPHARLQGEYNKAFFDAMASHVKDLMDQVIKKQSSDALATQILTGLNENDFNNMVLTLSILEENRNAINEKHQNTSGYVFRDTFKIEPTFPDPNILKKWRDLVDLLEHLSRAKPGIKMQPYKIYIPTLRTAAQLTDRAGEIISYDLMGQSVKANYNLPSGKNFELFTGGQLYDRINKEKRSEIEIQKRVKLFENFLSETFFDSKDVTITSMYDESGKSRHIKLAVEGKFERDLHNVGDGINTLIVIMYRVFMAPNNSWLFIEEPELNLHPGLQRIFLETLLTHDEITAKKLTIFFTTHSNHLLRIALPEYENVSIFSFQTDEEKREHFTVRPIHNSQSHALELLGVHNSSVLLANCGIWVEGPTDRKYIRAYLDAYMNSEERSAGSRHFIEDVHFAFWEYSGSNLSHYLFGDEDTALKDDVLREIRAASLANKIFLLADNDKNKEKKHEELRALNNQFFSYHSLKVIEVENLVPSTLLVSWLKTLRPFKNIDLSILSLTPEEYQDVRMGTYLAGKHSKFPEAAVHKTGGTLSTEYKNKLADHVAKNVTWESMTEAAKELTKELYQFIKKQNS